MASTTAATATSTCELVGLATFASGDAVVTDGARREKEVRDRIFLPHRCRVGLVHQLVRLGAARRSDTQEVYSDAVVLGDLYAYADIFVARQQDCIADGFLPGEFYEVCDNQ